MESAEMKKMAESVEMANAKPGNLAQSDLAHRFDSKVTKVNAWRGRRLRFALLIANLVLWTAGSCVAALSSTGFDSANAKAIQTVLVVFIQVIQLAPVLLAAVLAAWGPWRPWVRAAIFLLALVAAVGLRVVMEYHFAASHNSRNVTVVIFVDTVISWMVLMVPAILCLAMIGSWLRLRLGRPELQPVRVTIFGVMFATAVVGMVLAGKNASSNAYYQAVFEGETADSIVAGNRLSILLQAAIGGPLLAGLLGCVVAAAYKWWARLVTLGFVGIYGGVAYYFAMQTAPQFPPGQYNILVLIYGGMILGLLAACVWVMTGIRLLDRSGWPCSRRTRKHVPAS